MHSLERYHTDITQEQARALGFWFDSAEADQRESFFAACLRHSTGEFADSPFTLEPWERMVIRELFGWKRADGTRRYRRGSIWIPKKNGKSTLCSGLVLMMGLADREPDAEVYVAAVDRDNARIVFDGAVKMAKRSPALARRLKIVQSIKTMRSTVDGSVIKALSADADSAEGVNASFVVIDELHAHKSRKLFDTLYYSGSARRQPLQLSISTAGEYNPESVGWREWLAANRAIADPMADPEYFAFVATAGEDDDPADPAVWRAANPSMGVTLKESDFASEYQRALDEPTLMPNFLRYRLNRWVQAVNIWMPAVRWSACHSSHPGRRPWDVGAAWCGGLDLSSTTDITAFVAVWREGREVFCRGHYWMPADNVRAAELRDRASYTTWAADGWITLTPGNVVDQGSVEQMIVDRAGRGGVQSIGYDPWNARYLASRLTDAGVPLIEVRQGARSMSQPMKSIMEIVLEGRLNHGGDPVMAWMMGNVVAEVDENENIRPTKRKSTGRIDGPVALINAMAVLLAGEFVASAEKFVYTGL